MVNYILVYFVFVQIFLYCFPNTLLALTLDTKIANRSVSINLVKYSDMSQADWPHGGVNLSTVSITIEENMLIFDLLKSKLILPDVESYTLLYDLNPEMKDANQLVPGNSLVLPVVLGNPEVLKKIEDGYIFALTIDGEMKERIIRNAYLINNELNHILAVNMSPTSKRKIKENVLSAAEDITFWFREISNNLARRTGRTLRKGV